MRFFFFGSLMDADVIEVVLGRRVQPNDLVTATLSGYQRLLVAEESYPALLDRPGEQVSGVILENVSETEVARMQFFESEEFAPRELLLQLGDGDGVSAWVFTANKEVIQYTEEVWNFALWQRYHKQDYLELTRAWMARFGERTAAELEADWSTGRERAAIESTHGEL